MESLILKIQNYKQEIDATIVSDANAVEEFRIKWLGTKGILKSIMGEMRNVAAEQKKEAGQMLNDFKLFVEEKFEIMRKSINSCEFVTFDTEFTGSKIIIEDKPNEYDTF